jgi:ADP-heptose:LPS heptosyltransferase
VHNLYLLRALRKERYDLGIVLSATAFSTTNAMLVCLVNPKIIMGLRKPKQTLSIPQMLYNYEVPWPDGIHHRTQISLRTINPIVPEPAFKDETIHFSYLEISEAKKLLMIKGDKTFVGIHAGGTRDNKIWKLDNYKALIGMLSKNDKLQLVIFAGMPDEEKIIQIIIAGLDQKPITIGPFKNPSLKTFRTMIACISNLDLFIGNDTGTLHAAGATGVTTIGIYTGSNPSRWKPLNRNVHALWNPKVEDVKTAIYSLLENKLHPQGKEINKHGNSASVSAPAFSAID